MSSVLTDLCGERVGDSLDYHQETLSPWGVGFGASVGVQSHYSEQEDSG